MAGLRRFEQQLGDIYVEVSAASLLENLRDFLRDLLFDVRLLDERTLAARFRPPRPANQEAMEMEFDLYLRVWRAMHPGASAVRVEGSPRRLSALPPPG